MEITAKDILLIVVTIVFTLAINYFTSYTSSPIAQSWRNWRDREKQKSALKSVDRATTRLTTLRDELHATKYYLTNPQDLYILMFHGLGRTLLAMTLAVFMGFSSLFAWSISARPIGFPLDVVTVGDALGALTIVCFTWASVESLNTYGFTRKAANFPEYESHVFRQIEELEAKIKLLYNC